jgi:sulfate/thiosulfate transport system ATP-binding protein
MPMLSPPDGGTDVTERTGPRGAAIAVRDVVKAYDARAALHGVSLDVAQGELLALLGPSGSGKTTLLRVIAGLESHDSGSVAFDGQSTDALSVQERGVGFVFQHYALFRHLTIFDNVAYGLRVRPRRSRPPGDEIRRRVLQLLELVQLGGLEKRYPAQLSGGQRQRVALARALAIEPRVLLLDEPFGALDARVRKDLRRWLREIHGKTGQTTIFVTHDQDEAMELADRVAILNAGRIEQLGRPAEIYAAPRTAFIASFVGDPTALDVTVAGGRVRLGPHDAGAAPEGLSDGPAKLFAKASDVVLRPDTGGPDAGILPGRVMDLIWGSRGLRAIVAVDGVAQPLEVEAPKDMPLLLGDTVRLSLSQMTLFR